MFYRICCKFSEMMSTHELENIWKSLLSPMHYIHYIQSGTCLKMLIFYSFCFRKSNLPPFPPVVLKGLSFIKSITNLHSQHFMCLVSVLILVGSLNWITNTLPWLVLMENQELAAEDKMKPKMKKHYQVREGLKK